jgi:hypothetical protein
MSTEGYGGTGLTMEEAVAYDAQAGGAAPPLIAGIAQRLVDGAMTHGMPFADTIFSHCVKVLQLSPVDQQWILHHWGKIMMRQH